MTAKSDYELIPFVPALDLLEEQKQQLSSEEIATIAVALSRLLTPLKGKEMSAWEQAASSEQHQYNWESVVWHYPATK